MNNPKIYILFLVSIFFTACIPTKDLIYLQENKKTDNEVVSPLNQKPYRLQTSDILNVSVRANDPKLVEIFNLTASGGAAFGELASYFTGYSVDDHGNVRLPVLGELNVLGFTTEEVRLKIEKILEEKYFKSEAGIFVTVKLSGFRYTINGDVGSTGTKVLYQDKVNIMEAIANSGDIQITGDRKNVKVIRRYAQGNETFTIDLTNSNAVKSPAFYLQPNDYILVNPLKQKTWGTGKTGMESLTTFVTILTLFVTTYLLITLRN